MNILFIECLSCFKIRASFPKFRWFWRDGRGCSKKDKSGKNYKK
ncbi:hypothetical protein A2U01_0048303, partial [Trifolium medium]|nr:hypothetical protein [Trifolium medium]